VFGDNHRLRADLREHGRTADAELLDVKERPWANKRPGEVGAAGVFRLKLRVSPPDEPAFDVEVTDEWRDPWRDPLILEPQVGMRVAVLYDPKHHSKVVLAGRAARPAVGFDGPPKGGGDRGSVGSTAATATTDPELAALLELEQAESGPRSSPAVPAGGSQARLDRLQQLADLHERGVLSDDEFAAEKAKILNES
jgi:Short C-terminal domain